MFQCSLILGIIWQLFRAGPHRELSSVQTPEPHVMLPTLWLPNDASAMVINGVEEEEEEGEEE